MHEMKVDEALREGKISVQQDPLDNEVVSEGPRRSRPPLELTGKQAAALPAEAGVIRIFNPSWSSQLLLPL